MRFLCLCVVALNGLLAVQSIFMPRPMKTMVNILRGVLANDREWRVILTQVMKPESLDPGGMILAELGLTPEAGTGITPYQVVKQLVTKKSATGTQLKYGIRVLGLALEVQFAKSLAAHTLLTLKYTNHNDTTSSSVRYCISNIQVSLVVFADKVAFFERPIDFFWELNSLINKFFAEQHIVLDNDDIISSATRGVVQTFLCDVLELTKNQAASVEFDIEMTNKNILDVFSSNGDNVSIETIEAMDSHEKYSIINRIDYYDQVNVTTFGLQFGEKSFKVTRYKEIAGNDEDEEDE